MITRADFLPLGIVAKQQMNDLAQVRKLIADQAICDIVEALNKVPDRKLLDGTVNVISLHINIPIR